MAKKVYIPIMGDLFHIGHRRLLKLARNYGDWLIAGVVSDEGGALYKRVPIIPWEERAEIISDYVDEIVLQSGQDPTDNLKEIRPDVLIHSDDWPGDYPAFEYMKSIGREIIRPKYLESQSTTKIINKIKEGDEPCMLK